MKRGNNIRGSVSDVYPTIQRKQAVLMTSGAMVVQIRSLYIVEQEAQGAVAQRIPLVVFERVGRADGVRDLKTHKKSVNLKCMPELD